MRTFQRFSIILCLVFFAASFSVGQSASTVHSAGGPDLLSCSPAPCVLPPVWPASSSGFAADAPISASPLNPQQLLLGSANDNCLPQSGLGFYLSTDGGSDWGDLVCMTPFFSGQQEYLATGDPVLGYDRNGVAYIGGFYFDDNGRSSFGFEGFEKSSDGVNWSSPEPSILLKNYDPSYCWMAVDDSLASPYVNSIYISCVMVGPLNNDVNNQVVVAHSNDGGATWQQVGVAPMQKSPDNDFFTALAIGKDGGVYLTWMYCNTGPQACNNNRAYMVFSKSNDGGNTWSQPALVAIVTLETYLPNTFVGIRDTPAIAVDNSDGPNAGDLYVAMYNWTGTFMQVQVVRSTNGGNTWSKPVPVAPGITHDQFFPWISVSPAGLVGVSWLDRRNDPANINYQAFAGISANGGESFQPNVQLIAGFSDPNRGTANNTMGNYTGNTWDGPNYFLAAWMDDSNSQYMQDVVGGIRLK